jgi:hypothetical protein
MAHNPSSRKPHGHLDEEEIPEAGNLIVHWHEGGEAAHRHAYKMIGGPAPHMRYMTQGYIERHAAEGWDR